MGSRNNPIQWLPQKPRPPSTPTMQQALRVILTLVLLSAWAAPCAADYLVGQGLPVGDFLFSGYLNVEALVPQSGVNRLTLDDLSLFVSGRVNRWCNPFVEAEVSSDTLAQQGGGPREHGHFVRERIYDDVLVSDVDTLRIGKILAPVGDWNLIHAAPLVPTTTQPLTTTRGFANYTSGLSWVHEAHESASPDWQVYLQPGEEWLKNPLAVTPRQFRDVYGAHLNWDTGIIDKMGLSLQHGKLVSTAETYTLLGGNIRRTFRKLMLETEATTAQWSGGSVPRFHDTERGIFALADYNIAGNWHGIAEWEHYQDHQAATPSRNVLFGVAYKPRPAIVWKLEYVDQMGVAETIPTAWQASFAVLF
jgi:hypothetical protein